MRGIRGSPPAVGEDEPLEPSGSIGDQVPEIDAGATCRLGAAAITDSLHRAQREPIALIRARRRAGFLAAVLDGEDPVGDHRARRLFIRVDGSGAILLADAGGTASSGTSASAS